MIDAERVRAALAEAGRPDLAWRVGTNKAGHAQVKSTVRHHLSDGDLATLWRALRLSRGEEWVRSTPELDSPDKYVEFCRSSSTTATSTRPDVDHWCPLSERWADRFHRQCWEARP